MKQPEKKKEENQTKRASLPDGQTAPETHADQPQPPAPLTSAEESLLDRYPAGAGEYNYD